MKNSFIKKFFSKTNLIILSPFIIILSGFFTAYLFGKIIKEWAWIPLTIVLWGLMGLFILLGLNYKKINPFYFLKFKNFNFYDFLSLLAGFIPFALFVMNFNIIKNNREFIFFWIIFAIINPFFEEYYFRGILLIYTDQWKPIVSILFSTLLFALNHPISWGVNSIANRHPITFISTFLMGLIWAINFNKRKNLLYPIIGHFLVDIFNLSVFIFMNIYIPIN